MYMANVSPNATGPNMTYIPRAHIGPVMGPWGLMLGPWGFALGPFGFVLGLGGFSDTNMLVSPIQNARVWGLDQREGVRIAVEYRLEKQK